MDSAFGSVYRGPLEEFVARRDSLAKELRSAGDRAGATTVKGLRKPTRIAWALNLGAIERQHAFRRLVAAVAETIEAQATGDDVRAAMTELRAAVRQFAGQTADAAAAAGHTVEVAALTHAVFAVVGSAASFQQLRDGCLAEIPEADGLDVLAAVSPVPTAAQSSERNPPRSSPNERKVEAAAREAAKNAAARALREAKSKLETAETNLRHAEEAARAARKEWERARHEAETAAARLREFKG